MVSSQHLTLEENKEAEASSVADFASTAYRWNLSHSKATYAEHGKLVLYRKGKQAVR